MSKSQSTVTGKDLEFLRRIEVMFGRGGGDDSRTI